ncbi:HepT-like ribonuclease domain-containing protein [Pseudorhodoferax sp.]|uniref:HepT-like ribonuclease domain-containing protein n=1 Tax=Pseudorhodoferax sp. TaxID=1993553 RepID=UPI002DD63404|nr:HepT-like ribonuclease domain-containing protein [Pseudorhodoferax sp.]
MTLRVGDYLEHMRQAARTALSFVQGMDRAAFDQDLRTQHAVMLNVVHLGEAANRLQKEAPSFLAAHPEIPWDRIRGIRNRLAHGYLEINLDLVWNTLTSALPDLVTQLDAVISATSASCAPPPTPAS